MKLAKRAKGETKVADSAVPAVETGKESGKAANKATTSSPTPQTMDIGDIGVIGLGNLGNTCFFNSVLQVQPCTLPYRTKDKNCQSQQVMSVGTGGKPSTAAILYAAKLQNTASTPKWWPSRGVSASPAQ